MRRLGTRRKKLLVRNRLQMGSKEIKLGVQKHSGTTRITHPPSPPTTTDNTMPTLRRMEVHQTNETLGLWIAANGNQIAQMQVLWLLIERWIDKICTKQLTKTEAWLSLRMGMAKALRYPLTTTCLSKKDCKKLDNRLLEAALPALGFPPKYPHKIAEAPPEALGIGIPSIWNDQGIDHEAAMLLRHETSTHKMSPDASFKMQ
jgi:hypothetical protein